MTLKKLNMPEIPKAENHTIDWKALSQSEKIQRLQYVIKTKDKEFYILQTKLNTIEHTLESHTHSQSGASVIPLNKVFNSGIIAAGIP